MAGYYCEPCGLGDKGVINCCMAEFNEELAVFVKRFTQGGIVKQNLSGQRETQSLLLFSHNGVTGITSEVKSRQIDLIGSRKKLPPEFSASHGNTMVVPVELQADEELMRQHARPVYVICNGAITEKFAAIPCAEEANGTYSFRLALQLPPDVDVLHVCDGEKFDRKAGFMSLRELSEANCIPTLEFFAKQAVAPQPR